jgi:hypothetical protein
MGSIIPLDSTSISRNPCGEVSANRLHDSIPARHRRCATAMPIPWITLKL